jgi:hypothetical protein
MTEKASKSKMRASKGAGKSGSLTPLVKKLSGVIKRQRLDRVDYRKHLEKKYLAA